MYQQDEYLFALLHLLHF
ncbi:TPA: hypothetical protein ACPJ2X_000312 [Vibrio diabolicus]